MITQDIQAIVDRLRQDDVPRNEVAACLQHDAALVRINAMMAAVHVAIRDGDNDIVKLLAGETARPENSTRLFGTITVSHFAIECLLRIGTCEARKAAKQLIEETPTPERSNLARHLKAEGLVAPGGQRLSSG